ncbi:MAG: hypothetical protein IPM24_15165 [Bryobacterales bacterium]|nr:hypothetical protein [Bryobacterales bacterium]
MRTLLLLVSCLPLAAAVDGVVMNRTSGKPQANATVTLYSLGQAGMEAVESIKSAADGTFTIDRPADGPHVIQTAFDGVTYNHMLSPGAPRTGLQLEVFNSASRPGAAKVDQHMVLFEPAAGEMEVTENFLWRNDGTTTYNDPDRGTLRVFLPESARSQRVMATAPRGMPIERALEKTNQPNVYSIDFPIKPGETSVQVTYKLPFQSPAAFESRVLHNGGRTSLIAPVGVELAGEGLLPRGQEPRTQASIFEVKAPAYKVEISGTGALRAAAAAAEESSGPRIAPLMPKVYDRLVLLLVLSLAILALGFTLMFRAAKERR